MKICCRCKIEKSFENFYKWNRSKDGYTAYCRGCKKEDYKENREHYITIDKKSRDKKDPAEVKINRKKYREIHREHINNRSRKSYHKNKEDRKIKRDKYRIENKEKVKKTKLESYHRCKNREKENFIGPIIPNNWRICCDCSKSKRIEEFPYTASSKRWKARFCKNCRLIKCKKYRSKIENRIANRLRSNLRKIVKKHLVKKKDRTLSYLGCDLNFFIFHFESQYEPEMNRERFSDIDIEHYIPSRAFNLQDEEELRVCFNWTNLAPCWYGINSSKIDKMPDGRFARNTKDEYSLVNKKRLILSNLLSKNLPHITEELLRKEIIYSDIIDEFFPKKP